MFYYAHLRSWFHFKVQPMLMGCTTTNQTKQIRSCKDACDKVLVGDIL